MSLFEDADGNFVYSGPRFSTAQQRVGELYAAYSDAIHNARGSGVINVGVPDSEPYGRGTVEPLTGAGFKHAEVSEKSAGKAPLAHVTRNPYFGTDGRIMADAMSGPQTVLRFIDRETGGGFVEPIFATNGSHMAVSKSTSVSRENVPTAARMSGGV